MSQNPFKLLVLYLVAILLTTLNLNGINSPGILSISLPIFEIMVIYYFAIHKEDVFGFWFIFFLGILSDSLNGLPLGVTSLIYIVIVKIFHLVSQKQAPKEDFKAILKEFLIFISIILALKWLILSIYYKSFYNIVPFVIQIFTSSIAYILIHRFFEFLSKKLLMQDSSASRL